MQEELLVSVISPCYNGEKYLKHFLESLLEQTYSNVEFIIVNDGSNDNSEKIILSYKDKIEKKGWTFKYIFQENKGQAAAINRGLSIFKGKYLMWVDSDDILKKDNIKHKVDFLNKNPGCGMVICETEVVNENNLNKRIKILKRHNKKQKNDNLTGYRFLSCTFKTTYMLFPFWKSFESFYNLAFLGQALTLLVAVSSVRCRTSTPALSTSSSSRGFTSFEWDISS